jgi:predicted kinase
MGSFIEIVAFNAVPSSGKTTVAAALVELHGWVKLSPAEAMRRALAGLGYPPEIFTDTALKEVPRIDMYGLSPRQL